MSKASAKLSRELQAVSGWEAPYELEDLLEKLKQKTHKPLHLRWTGKQWAFQVREIEEADLSFVDATAKTAIDAVMKVAIQLFNLDVLV